jgi:hypothetical protein
LPTESSTPLELISSPPPDLESTEENSNSKGEDDMNPIQGTRSLANIYARSYMADTEHVSVEFALLDASVEFALLDTSCKSIMLEELKIIETPHTWCLIDHPIHKKVIRVGCLD